ncbi:MAG: type II toxin-antitoxin system PemK/MazF family toxin [Planctomycetes bacterium]|nr:type II toxin-antitoxin system PemK/MazF family toxin [Planctomycetota bacterium]
MVINQGEIYWVELDLPLGSEPGYIHPCVVVQNNLLNRTRIGTVVICALTSHLGQARFPGNVLLDPGEGGLPKQSVVVVSQLLTVSRSRLRDKIGTLSRKRVEEIIEGISLILVPRGEPSEW